MRLVDLTRTIDPQDRERVPEWAKPLAGVLAPEIEYLAPDAGGLEQMMTIMGVPQEDLPDGEGWGAETLTNFYSHLGTHVDAPLHYGSTCEGKPARTITDIELDELFVDGFVLDLRGQVKPNEGIPVDVLERAVAALGADITPASAIMVRTGQEEHDVSDPGFFEYPGMTRDGTLYLASLGAKILGTDALGWDRPFPVMVEAYKRTGDPGEIWDGHFAGRDREVFIIQQMANLGAVPTSGFKVAFFPIKLARASAAPARVVAFVE